MENDTEGKGSQSGSEGSGDSEQKKSKTLYEGKRFSRKEKASQTIDSEGVRKIVSAIETSADKSAKEISGTIEKESQETRKKMEDLNKEVIDKLEKIRLLQDQIANASNPMLVNNAIDGLRDELKPLINGLKDAMTSVTTATEKEAKLLDKLIDSTIRNEGALGNLEDELKITKEVTQMYLEQMESQIPAQLRNPTEKRMLDGLTNEQKEEYKDTGKVDGKEWKDAYQDSVENWFEARVREMESYELSFEEQGETYRYIALYVNSFKLNTETEILGKRLMDKLETRRIAHRLARVWDISGPESILQEASRISYTTLSKIFKEGGHEAQDQLQNYERMGRILRERRDELLELLKSRGGKKAETPEERALEKEIKAKELYILDYYKLGGAVEDVGMADAYKKEDGTLDDKYNGKTGKDRVGKLNSNDNQDGYYYRLGKDFEYDEKERAKTVDSELKSKDLSDDEVKELRDQYWAKKYAGKLWSISFRAAYHDVLLNGTGDFYASRIMNFTDRLRGNVLMRESEEVWNPTKGSFKDKPFDIGYVDIISEITSDIDKNKKIEISNLEKLSKQRDLRDDEVRRLKDLKKEYKKDMESVGIFLDGSGKRDTKGVNLRTLENFKWCSDEDGKSVLWDEALAKPESRPKEGVTSVRMTYFNDADNSRKKMWGADSFFHKPTIEGLVGMEGVFAHMGTGSGEYPVFDLNGKPTILDEKGEPLVIRGISGVESKWIEMIDRSCSSYLRSEKAEDWLGSPLIGYAEKATIREWIRSAVKNGTIDLKTQKILLEKHLGTSNTWKLNRISEISVLWNDFKTNYATMSLQGFMDFLKRAFGYVFSDDIR